MLDPWIIEEIRRREEEERRDDQPVLEVPRDVPTCPSEREVRDENERKPDEERGVVILDLLG